MQTVPNKTLIFIPTYNERDNVQKLAQEIKGLQLLVDILFCDDNSPDGTGRILDAMAAKDETIKVMHRPAKLGLGTAHRDAYKFAREHGYENLITMDADFTHDPNYIPKMLEKKAKEEADIVIGSRYAGKGKMSGWSKIRLPFTYFWRNAIKYGLGMPYDCTGAFRLYNVSILKPEVYNKLQSKGFSFNIESLYRFLQCGSKVSEVPIHARQREHGESKLSAHIMIESAKQFLSLFFERLFSKKQS